MFSRVRVLPPLELKVYNALLQLSVAVLDPFPVGMHVPIIEALLMGVPVVR
jgi:predicted O-linked N-acetylglucosamine transferase (SPINDLY family)